MSIYDQNMNMTSLRIDSILRRNNIPDIKIILVCKHVLDDSHVSGAVNVTMEGDLMYISTLLSF